MTMITQARLKEILSYDPETGLFTWRLTNQGHAAGEVAGTDRYGYRQICILGKYYRAHRLAWLYMTGEWPVKNIDHINCVRSDNRFENLRMATYGENNMNMRRRSDNKTGFKGVIWDSHRQAFRATIHKDGKHIYLGRFDTAFEAHKAYCEAANRLHGEFARVA